MHNLDNAYFSVSWSFLLAFLFRQASFSVLDFGVCFVDIPSFKPFLLLIQNDTAFMCMFEKKKT